MQNFVSVKAKANAHYTCQECGSTELIQAHHEIPDDDNTLVVLCAECHSKKHPNLPKALFFNKRIQPYWHNKSVASLARELNVCSRTVIRIAKKLEIPTGKLSLWNEELIKNNIPKLNRKLKVKEIKKVSYKSPQIILVASQLVSIPRAAEILGVHFVTVYRWVKDGKLNVFRIGNQTYLDIDEVKEMAKKKPAVA